MNLIVILHLVVFRHGDSLMQFDALIVGAGPAGATTALLLAQAGWSVAIIEKKSFPRRKVCGEFISATNLPLLHQLGLANLYLAQGGPEIQRVGLFAADAMLVAKMPPNKHSTAKWGRAFGREHLDSALLEQAVNAGAKLWQPYQAINLQRHAAVFTCTIASQEETKQIHAKIIIMAQGSWERGLQQTNNEKHKSSDLLAFKAHFKKCNLEDNLMPLLAFPGGYGGLVNTDDGRVTLSFCIRRDTLEIIRQKYQGMAAGEAALCHIKANLVGVDKVLKHAQRQGNWLAVGPIRPGIRKRYDNGIFYVGNCAGEAHPVVAEGISMAMQSGWLLSQILITQQGKNTKLDVLGKEYSRQWTKHFAKRIKIAALFAQFAMRPRLTALLLPLFKRLPRLITFSAELSGKIQQVVTTGK